MTRSSEYATAAAATAATTALAASIATLGTAPAATSPEAAAAEAAALGRDLIESDALYFEGGALVEDLGGAVLAHMPGLASLPAGCVVHRVEAAHLPGDLDGWLERVEARLAAAGCRSPRLYLAGPLPSLEAALAARGYVPRVEIGFVTTSSGEAPARAGEPRPRAQVVLAPVDDPSAWKAKLALHREAGRAPDGHDYDAEGWVELERRKAAAGALRPFLMLPPGDAPLAAPLGAVAFAPCGALLRLKNIVVHPAHRRRGVSTATIALGASAAASLGARALGCFAVEGGAGERLYRSCGLIEVVRQTEWMRS